MPFQDSEIRELRRDTPGIAEFADCIHFNNAGCSLPPNRVLTSVKEWLDTEARIGGYALAAKRSFELEQGYANIASVIGAQASEIAQMESATVAWNRAFRAVPFEAGDNIVCSRLEYASNYLNFLRLKEDLNIEIRVAAERESGGIDLEDLRGRCDERTRLIAVTHIPTQEGIVQDVSGVGRIAEDLDVLYLVDACQSIGQVDLQVEDIGCDFLSGTGRKYLRGPRGTGFLYVKSASLERLRPASIDLGSATWDREDGYHWAPAARRFETWEASHALRAGMSAAMTYLEDLGQSRVEERVRALGAELRESLGKVEGVQVLDRGDDLGGIVTFVKEGEEPSATQARLARSGVRMSTVVATSSLLAMQDRALSSASRASVHYYNTSEEIGRFCRLLARA